MHVVTGELTPLLTTCVPTITGEAVPWEVGGAAAQGGVVEVEEEEGRGLKEAQARQNCGCCKRSCALHDGCEFHVWIGTRSSRCVGVCIGVCVCSVQCAHTVVKKHCKLKCADLEGSSCCVIQIVHDACGFEMKTRLSRE